MCGGTKGDEGVEISLYHSNSSVHSRELTHVPSCYQLSLSYNFEDPYWKLIEGSKWVLKPHL